MRSEHGASIRSLRDPYYGGGIICAVPIVPLRPAVPSVRYPSNCSVLSYSLHNLHYFFSNCDVQKKRDRCGTILE